jgi:hypothetical protein
LAKYINIESGISYHFREKVGLEKKFILSDKAPHIAWSIFIPLPAIFKFQQSCDFCDVVPGHVTFSKVVDNISKVPEMKKIMSLAAFLMEKNAKY